MRLPRLLLLGVVVVVEVVMTIMSAPMSNINLKP
jgi:hypothetical protein